MILGIAYMIVFSEWLWYIILNLRSSFPAFIQRVKDGHAGVPQLPDFLMHKLQPFILL